MTRKLFLFLFIFFIPLSFLSIPGCNQNIIKEDVLTVKNTRNEDYELQESCRKESDKYFTEKYSSSNFSYQNHYNKKLHKCFLLMASKRDKIKDLYAISESTHYGMFMDDKHGMYCNVLIQECENETEWDLLVKPYMEE